MSAVAGETRVARAATAAADPTGSAEAGRAAARAALAEFGADDVDVALCVHHGRHDGEAILRAVRKELGPRPSILGGTAVGVITNDDLGREGRRCGVALLGAGEGQTARVASATGLGTRGERRVGDELMRRLAGHELDGTVFLYSSVRRGLAHPEGLALNAATPFVAGLTREGVKLAGAGLVDSRRPQGSHVFGDHGVDPDGAVALGVGGGLRLDSVVLETEGCVEARVRHLVEGLGERRPVLALYLDCAVRRVAGRGMEEEGDAVRAAIGEIPLLGFSTGARAAPGAGTVRPLDRTSVLCLLSA